MKIQFGCGENRLDGWENHDNDLDVTKLPIPFADESATEIFAEHLAEHLTGPQCLRFMDECFRILKPFGILRICCPVITDKLQKDHARDLVLGHGHQLMMTEEVMRMFFSLSRFGSINKTQRRPQDSHWKVIGEDRDDLETCRMEGIKYGT